MAEEKKGYIKTEELKSRISADPSAVEKVTLLTNGRVNVKIKGETSNFFSTLIDKRGRERYTELIQTLTDNKVSFDLINKVENKKLVYAGGSLVRTVGLVKSTMMDVSMPDADDADPKETEKVLSAPTPGTHKAGCDSWDNAGFFDFDGLQYPIRKIESLSENARKMIPKITNYVPIPEVKQIISCIRNDQAVYLEGHTGVGKTECIKWIAAKTNNPLVIIQGSEDMETADLIGHMEIDKDGTFYVEGLLTTAVREGYWCYISEINAIPAGVKIAMHGLLDDCRHLILSNKDGERIEAHEQFRIFSDGNPVDAGVYAGVSDENLAFLNRYCKILVDYLPERVERNVLTENFPHIDKTVSKQIVNAAKMVRKAFEEGRITGVVTTRDLKMLCANLRYLSMDEALVMIINKFQKEDRKTATDYFEQHFGELKNCRASFTRG